MRDGLCKNFSFSNSPADRRIRSEWQQVSHPLLRPARSADASEQLSSHAQTPAASESRDSA